jgi:hypothetical protein
MDRPISPALACEQCSTRRTDRGTDTPMVPLRRFPPPWSVEEQQACFIVRDANDQVLAYGESGRRALALLRPATI